MNMKMTPRESGICRGILKSKTDKEIGRDMGIHPKAVERAIPLIKLKVGGARNRVELALKLQKITWADGQ